MGGWWENLAENRTLVIFSIRQFLRWQAAAAAAAAQGAAKRKRNVSPSSWILHRSSRILAPFGSMLVFLKSVKVVKYCAGYSFIFLTLQKVCTDQEKTLLKSSYFLFCVLFLCIFFILLCSNTAVSLSCLPAVLGTVFLEKQTQACSEPILRSLQ